MREPLVKILITIGLVTVYLWVIDAVSECPFVWRYTAYLTLLLAGIYACSSEVE